MSSGLKEMDGAALLPKSVAIQPIARKSYCWMFSLFKKKSTRAPTTTFKTRVKIFWDWYALQAPRFYQTIEKGNCADLQDEVSEHVDRLLPGGAWEFDANPAGPGHAFTLTGEG